jgi:lysozyme family protein
MGEWGMNFDQALAIVLKHEGGYVNHPSDPGGETNYGITKAVAQRNGYHGDMRTIPMDVVARIYKKDYWDAVKADELPPAVRYAVFDGAVNSGPVQSIKWLQRAVGARDDGILGPVTMGLVRDTNQEKLLRVLLGQRLSFMASLSSWPAFGRGWARRIADLLEV